MFGDGGMALAAVFTVASGRERLEDLLDVGHQHPPVLPLPVTGAKLELFRPVLSDAGAVCCIDSPIRPL